MTNNKELKKNRDFRKRSKTPKSYSAVSNEK